MVGSVRGPRGVGFIGLLADIRKEKQAPGGKGQVPGGPAPARFQGQAQLNQIGVDPKLIRAHGPVLATALKPLTALHTASRAGEPWQVKAFGRVLGQSHKLLGQQLQATPTPLREEAAQSTAGAWADLVARPSVGGHAPFALAAASGLLDSGLRMNARGSLDYDGPHVASLGAASADAVGALADRLVGRDAAATVLNLFPRLVETVEMASKGLSPADREALVARTADFVLGTFPASGGHLGLASDLARALTDAAEAHPGDLDATFSAARAAFLEASAEERGLARATFDEPPHDALAPLFSALQGVVDAHPAGPAALFAILRAPNELGAMAEHVAQHPAQAPVIAAATELVQRTAKTPVASVVAGWTLTNGLGLVRKPAAGEALAASLKEEGAGAVARGLVRAELALLDQDPAALDAQLGALDALEPVQALIVGLVVRAHAVAVTQHPDFVAALVARIQTSGANSPLLDLGGFADAYLTAAHNFLEGRPALDAKKGAILTGIASQTPDEGVGPPIYKQLYGMLSDVGQRIPKADLPSAIGPDADGRAGLFALANPGRDIVTPPATTLTQLLDVTQNGGEDHDALLRLLMPLALDLAFIQNGAAIHIPRVVKDLEAAVADPAKLTPAAGGQGQAALRSFLQKPSLAKYAEQHPELPLDLLATAAVHLSADQVAWVQGKVSGMTGLDTVRALRDTVFASVEAGRTDLIEALRTSTSPSKAVSAVLKSVAQNYRTQQVGEVPFDAFVKGLKAGEDPVAQQIAERTKAQLGGLDLHALAEGQLTPEGVGEIESLAKNVAELLNQYRTEFKSMDKQIDMGKLRPVLEACLKSVAQGTWPTPKYEDEVGQRQMAVLDAAQQAVWRSQTVVSEGAVAPVVDVDLSVPVGLLKGLKAQLAGAVQLPDGVEINAETAERLTGELDGLLKELRAADKGSEAHRAAGLQAGAVRDQLSIVELGLALEAMNEGAAPNALVAELGPILERAQAGLRRLGAPGLVRATAEVVLAARDMAPATGGTRSGRYAMDDDTLTGLIASHKSGCLAMGSNLRRWGLAGSLSDANTKMVRVMNGDKQLWRAFLRMVPMKIGNYEGPGLYIEGPVADSGGNAQDRKLLDQAVFEKARQMGVPALFTGGQVQGQPPEGWTNKGKTQVTLTYDYGHTGLYHSDYVGQQINQANEPGSNWQVATQNLQVFFPPGLEG